MLRLFDYAYYRINRFYSKIDKEDSITAPIAISAIEFFILWDIIGIFKVLGYNLSSHLHGYERLFATLNVVVLGVLMIVNYRIYSPRLDEMRKRWENDKEFDRLYVVRGWLIFFLVIAPFVLTLILLKV
jgi:hypothetical protein